MIETTDPDYWLSVTKFASTGLAFIFGVLALLTNVRDKTTNRIRPAGWFAIAGVLITSAVSIVSQIKERDKTVREAKSDNDKIQRQIREINRTLSPLNDLRASFWLTLPSDASSIDAYRRRLVRDVTSRLSRGPLVPSDALPFRDLSPDIYDGKGKVVAYAIPYKTRFFPNQDRERPAFDMITRAYVRVALYRKPVTIEHMSSGVPESDLYSFIDGNHVGGKRGRLRLELKSDAMKVYSEDVPFTLKNGSGRILSLLDLEGAQLWYEGNAMRDQAGLHSSTVDALQITVGNRAPMTFSKDNPRVKQWRLSDGRIVYEYDFPGSLEQIISDTGAK